MVTEIEQGHIAGGASFEVFVVTAAVTGVAGAVLLAGLTWRHLWAKQISPADSPIRVE
jgi:hypothetical protein